jgi:uncharacterized protein YecE (DUF72 family)
MSRQIDLRVGCCGFSVALARYAETFSVVEVQQTFYQPPQLRTLEKWRSQTSPKFEFTLKAWQLITHEAGSPTYRRLREKLNDRQKREAGDFRASATVMAAWQRTLQCAQALSSRLILFQCPARFSPTRENKNNLRGFFHELNRQAGQRGGEKHLTFAWEPRGEWKPEEVGELCGELGLVHAVDPFQHAPVTSGLAYFRLHGRSGYRYRFTDSDLGQLMAVACRYASCYVLFNNISMFEDAGKFDRYIAS